MLPATDTLRENSPGICTTSAQCSSAPATGRPFPNREDYTARSGCLYPASGTLRSSNFNGPLIAHPWAANCKIARNSHTQTEGHASNSSTYLSLRFIMTYNKHEIGLHDMGRPPQCSDILSRARILDTNTEKAPSALRHYNILTPPVPHLAKAYPVIQPFHLRT